MKTEKEILAKIEIVKTIRNKMVKEMLKSNSCSVDIVFKLSISILNSNIETLEWIIKQ